MENACMSRRCKYIFFKFLILTLSWLNIAPVYSSFKKNCADILTEKNSILTAHPWLEVVSLDHRFPEALFWFHHLFFEDIEDAKHPPAPAGQKNQPSPIQQWTSTPENRKINDLHFGDSC